MDVEHILACNCAWGCPCNFDALPTYGNCEGILGYRVIKGMFGTTRLDGVLFAQGVWWPKAIHERNGTIALYIDPNASPEQIRAIEEITSGKHGGGIFAIFPTTVSKTLPTKITSIDWNFDSYDSWFTVEGVAEVHSEKIKNPVSGETMEASIVLPNGIGFRETIVSSIRNWWMNDRGLSFRHENCNGHVATAKFANQGCIG